MDHSHEMVSPSRTYVAQCFNHDFKGYYFRKFVLPERDGSGSECLLSNEAETASWYFLNRIDFVACTNGCMTFEDYSDVKEVR